MPTNIFVYADDIVLLCPLWYAMKVLLTVLEKHCVLLDLYCNINKTVCMVFKHNLPAEIKMIQSCSSFKYKFKKLLFTVFGLGYY